MNAIDRFWSHSPKAESEIDLGDVVDEIMECRELEEWGRYIRAEKSPAPSTSPGKSFIATMMVSSRDEDDPAPIGDFNPDKCYKVLAIISTLPDICQRVLYAYYCQWPESVRSCSKHMISNGLDVDSRLTERAFSKKLAFAQGLVMGKIYG